MKIQTILRAQDVTRWNIVHTVRKQSLAEHLFNTAALASYICHKMGRLDLVAEAVSYALLHDIDEVITGDIPSPTKAKARSKGVDLNAILATEPPMEPRPEVVRIVKAADLLDNLWYIENYGHGRHANEVKLRMHATLYKGWHSDATEFAAAREVYHELTHGEVEI